jgi:hypothetical protein
MTAAAILIRAAEIVAPNGAWTQRATARASNGDVLLHANDADAVCWCVGGALHAATFELTGCEDGKSFEVAAQAAAEFGGFGEADEAVAAEPLDWLIGWNDEPGRRQVDVVALLDGAAREMSA